MKTSSNYYGIAIMVLLWRLVAISNWIIYKKKIMSYLDLSDIFTRHIYKTYLLHIQTSMNFPS